MSPAGTQSVTGDRVTQKVRRIAGEFPELGRIRHVEANPPSPTAWWVTVGFSLFVVVGITIGSGGIVSALIQIPVLALFAWIILGYLGAEKVVVLDRGLLIGSFALFLRPAVVVFDRFEVDSITAVRPGWKLAGMLHGHQRLTTGRTTVWAWNAVAFVADFGPSARRRYVDAARLFEPEDPARRQRIVWWFGTWRQPDRLVRALESALVDLGKPVAGLSQHVLPMGRVSGQAADAATQVPRLVAALERTS
jgi:hypothetical protein